MTYRVLVVLCMCLGLTGCVSSSKPQKYDAAQSADPTKAVIVVGTKNVSYFDIQRYGSAAPATQTQPEPALPDNKAKLAEPVKVAATNDDCCDFKKPENTDSGTESADPMKMDYTNSSFNLRYLFDSNSPSNLGEERRQDRKESTPDSDGKTDQKSKRKQSSQIAPAKKVAAKSGSREYRIHKASASLFSMQNYTKSTYTIEPGVYYIAFAFYEHDHNVNFTRLPGISKSGEVQYGAFEIKAGEVLYIGDVNFDWVNKDKANMVHIVDNFNGVKKDLIEAGHRDLAVKIEKAQFYPHGTKISMNQLQSD